MRAKRKNRLLSLGLCLCMLFSITPTTGIAYAAETPCPNHLTHTPECGYVEAVEGAPCKHLELGEHDENCGYTEGTPEVPCDMGCTELDEDGQIIHAEGCAYTPAVPGTPCKHELGEHDENCGYIEAVEGAPCTHTCELCDGSGNDLPEPCTKTEGCTLPAGHEGACLTAVMLDAPPPANDFIDTPDYAFYPLDGLLTVKTDAGTASWRSNPNIKASDVLKVTVMGLVQNIEGAFKDCTRLTSVDLPDSLKTIGRNAFYNCTSLTSVNMSATSLTAIEYQAFYGCTSLTSVDLPASLETIDHTAFSNCTNLAAINVSADNLTFSSEGAVLYNKEKTTLIQYPSVLTATAFSVPLTVENIGDSAFYNCSLTSVELPAGLTAIGESAFNGCTKLEKLTFLGSAPPSTIGANAFGGIAASGAIFYPAEANGYTKDWRSTLGLSAWRLWKQGATDPDPETIEGNGFAFAPLHRRADRQDQ